MNLGLLRPDFWHRKRVLLTGHTGFKGGWLTILLRRLGAQVDGVSLPPQTVPNLFSLAEIGRACTSSLFDIREATRLAEHVERSAPEIVLHLAAQPLVRASYRGPVETFATNVLGTVHLLEAVRIAPSARVVVVVTTDKVYLNREWAWPYRECDELGGRDPYSASKAAAELACACYRASFLESGGVALATARAGNVIGGGDWAEDRVIPDAVRAWISNSPLVVRHPLAVRPWQHVLEPLVGYLQLAQHLWENPGESAAYNFGPNSDAFLPVGELVEQARHCFGRGEIRYETQPSGPYESSLLTLEIARARTVLGFRPRLTVGEAIERTMRWYRNQHEGASAAELCARDLDWYLERCSLSTEAP